MLETSCLRLKLRASINRTGGHGRWPHEVAMLKWSTAMVRCELLWGSSCASVAEVRIFSALCANVLRACSHRCFPAREIRSCSRTHGHHHTRTCGSKRSPIIVMAMKPYRNISPWAIWDLFASSCLMRARAADKKNHSSIPCDPT